MKVTHEKRLQAIEEVAGLMEFDDLVTITCADPWNGGKPMTVTVTRKYLELVEKIYGRFGAPVDPEAEPETDDQIAGDQHPGA